VIARAIKTGHYAFIFLTWNLFLAWLPLFFARSLSFGSTKPVRYFLLGLAISFLPNAPYILTDLFHLKANLVGPMWFDLVLILVFAFLGLVYFIMALELILAEMRSVFKGIPANILKAVLLLATGYGIYLGRYLRYNSWDIVSRPVSLAGDIIHSMTAPSCYKETWAVTITFTVFLYLINEIYLSFKHQTHGAI
jgi:uncharacterized membrane protein